MSRRLMSTPSRNGFPLVQSLHKYFGGLECIPIINDQNMYNRSHISGVFVLSPMYKPFEHSLSSNAISGYKWCYNVKGMDGGQYIANFSSMDGIIYALHQVLCDGILIGAKNLCCASEFTFMSYTAATFPHVTSLEPNLWDILLDQSALLKQNGLIQRDYPAVIITTQTGQPIVDHKGTTMDFLDCNVFKHINPFTSDYIDVHIITSIKGAEEISKRWNQYDHLRDRNMDHVVIIVSDVDTPHIIKTELITQVLYNEPYNIKYITCEGGMILLQKLMECRSLSQLHCTLMHKCITDRIRTEYAKEDSFECMDVPWNPVMGVGYEDHLCSFVIFDCH
eukprot:229717_1